MSGLNSSSDRFGTYCFVSHTTLAWPSHVSCLFICSLLMFNHVYFTTRVISGFAVRYPIMFSVNHAAIFVWIFSPWFPWFSWLAHSILLESTTLSHCSASTTSWNVATRPLSVFSLYRRFRRCDFEALAHCSCPDSHFSTYAFWHDSLLPVSRHLLTIDLTRATHCPVIAPVVNTVRSSSPSTEHHPPGATPVRDTCLSIANNAIPFITSVGSSAPTSRSVTSLQKTPSIITASSTIHAAHAFFQLRIIACSWAPFSPLLSHRPHQRPTLVFISRDSRTFPRTFIRQRY